MKENKFLLLAIALAVAVFAGVVTWVVFPRNTHEISASGTIEATEVVVSTKVSGDVLELPVPEGDKVAKGEIIAQLDNLELVAAYKQAKANAALAASNLKRTEELYKSGYASPQALDAARAAKDAAAATEDLAAIRLKDSTITAPISGYVIVRSVEKGELAVAGSPIMTLADLSTVHMIVYVSESQVGKVKLGDRAYVFSDSYPNEKFEGRVTYISQVAEFTPKTIQTKEERVTQVFGVKVEVPNPLFKLKPGLPADALINI